MSVRVGTAIALGKTTPVAEWLMILNLACGQLGGAEFRNMTIELLTQTRWAEDDELHFSSRNAY